MKFGPTFLAATFVLVWICACAAQGFHWNYTTRITQHYDSAEGQKAAAAPAPESVPYPVYPVEMVGRTSKDPRHSNSA